MNWKLVWRWKKTFKGLLQISILILLFLIVYQNINKIDFFFPLFGEFSLLIFGILIIQHLRRVLKWYYLWVKSTSRYGHVLIHLYLYLIIISMTISVSGVISTSVSDIISKSIPVLPVVTSNEVAVVTTPVVTTEPEVTVTTSVSIEELRDYALQLINKDRKKYGLEPVVLGNNKAAQLHAEDMLENRFLSHWGSDGSKPYMRYTEQGGHGGVAENAGFSGFFDYEPNAAPIEPRDAIKKHQYSMMYDDASSNWGHRDNIIDKNHNKVNIGIAYDGTHLAYVQDFEDDYISWSEPFVYNSGTLSMAGTTSFGTIESIALFYDPLPQPLSHNQLLDSEHSGSYGLGEEIGYIIQPSYFMQGTKYVNAYRWSISNSGSFSISANIQPLLYKGKGVYTVVIWATKVPLTTYSLFIN